MTSPAQPWNALPDGPLTALDDHLSMSLSLDDLPDLPGARAAIMGDEPDPLPGHLLAWSEDAELRSIHFSCDDPIVIELPHGEWQSPSEPLS
jgi:hypothetical protein